MCPPLLIAAAIVAASGCKKEARECETGCIAWLDCVPTKSMTECMPRCLSTPEFRSCLTQSLQSCTDLALCELASCPGPQKPSLTCPQVRECLIQCIGADRKCQCDCLRKAPVDKLPLLMKGIQCFRNKCYSTIDRSARECFFANCKDENFWCEK